jgi:hypothetical protein
MRRILACLLILFLEIQVNAQSNTPITKDDTTLIQHFKLNFAVPDIPALKILGNSPSEILKPSTPENLSVIASELFNGSNIVIPKSMAVEIAPLLLLNSKMTLEQYDKSAILYSVRLSAGTFKDNDNHTSKLALGTRITLIDKGDLKNDKAFREQLFRLTNNIISTKDKIQDEFLKINKYNIQDVVVDSALNAQMNKYINERYSPKHLFEDSLESLKMKYKQDNWNKQKWDIALGVLGYSPDSLAKKITFGQFSFWTTYAQPISTWGQILVGANVNYIKDTANFLSISASTRIYGGINRIKAFLEAQYSYNGNDKTGNCLFNFGSELGVIDGMWINLSAGIEWNNLNKNDYDSNFTSEFDIRFSLPEYFHF